MFAAKESRLISQLEMLLQAHAKVNMFDRNKETALHFACRAGNFDILDVLLRNGGDVHAESYENEKPFDCISDKHMEERIRYKSFYGMDLGNDAPQYPASELSEE